LPVLRISKPRSLQSSIHARSGVPSPGNPAAENVTPSAASAPATSTKSGSSKPSPPYTGMSKPAARSWRTNWAASGTGAAM
jgi:hypothetical protein